VNFSKIKEQQNTKLPPFCCGGDDNPPFGEQRGKIRIVQCDSTLITQNISRINHFVILWQFSFQNLANIVAMVLARTIVPDQV